MYVLEWKETGRFKNAVVGEFLTMDENDSTSSLDHENLVVFDSIDEAKDESFPGNLMDSLHMSKQEIEKLFTFREVKINLVEI